MISTPRYVIEDQDGWYRVKDTVVVSYPAIINGRGIYSGPDKAKAQADADWLNEVRP